MVSVSSSFMFCIKLMKFLTLGYSNATMPHFRMWKTALHLEIPRPVSFEPWQLKQLVAVVGSQPSDLETSSMIGWETCGKTRQMIM